eukprot:Selendium_serpulae@DN8627_c0_g1_i1.p1
MSNWERRPLTSEKVEYAVLYVAALVEMLKRNFTLEGVREKLEDGARPGESYGFPSRLRTGTPPTVDAAVGATGAAGQREGQTPRAASGVASRRQTAATRRTEKQARVPVPPEGRPAVIVERRVCLVLLLLLLL